MNPPNGLIDFCSLLQEDENLQSQVKAAKSPKEIVDFAASLGHNISREELRLWSRELKAAYFPWSEMGHEWRRNFFN